MTKKLLLTLTFISLAFINLLTGCNSRDVTPLNSSDVILAFGDSLTQGVGASNKPYPEALTKLSGLKVINAGISGETTDKGLARFSDSIEEYNPALVILLEGGNDILRNYNIASTKQNLASMIETAQSFNVEVVLIGVPEKKIFSSSSPIYKELADEYNLAFEGKILAELLRQREFKSDMVHLNDKGYQQLADSIYDLLVDEGYL